jgi:hypothetical protein
MRNKLLNLFVLIALTACNKGNNQTGDTSTCEPKVCTTEAVSIKVKFLDKNGQPVVVNNYSSINKRTGLAIKYAGAASVTYQPGVYWVATDGNLKETADDGDEVLVSGTNPTTSQTKTATFKIFGGCRCHIGKTTGPAEITFD